MKPQQLQGVTLLILLVVASFQIQASTNNKPNAKRRATVSSAIDKTVNDKTVRKRSLDPSDCADGHCAENWEECATCPAPIDTDSCHPDYCECVSDDFDNWWCWNCGGVGWASKADNHFTEWNGDDCVLCRYFTTKICDNSQDAPQRPIQDQR